MIKLTLLRPIKGLRGAPEKNEELDAVVVYVHTRCVMTIMPTDPQLRLAPLIKCSVTVPVGEFWFAESADEIAELINAVEECGQ